MKNISKFILLIAIIVIAHLLTDSYRYHLNLPMADIAYKKSIIKDSRNLTYNLEALRPIMGPEELATFIKANDNNPDIYTPSKKNINTGIYRANLHMHTTKSDGTPTVEQRMNAAQDYAEKHIKDGYMVIAITDHNTVLGAKEVIKVLEKHKNKYTKIKIIPGIEIFTQYQNSNITEKPVEIHVLTWCINPYNKYLKREFHKKDPNDMWNRTYPDRDFDWTIQTMSDYGMVGIAHPARYTSSLGNKKYQYITEMLTKYQAINKNIKFTEGYYQSYKQTSTGEHLGSEYDKYINHINNEAKRLHIIRTGSTDAHGDSLFGYRENKN